MWCPSNNCWIVPSTTVPWKEQKYYLLKNWLSIQSTLPDLILLLPLLDAPETVGGEEKGRSWLCAHILGTLYRDGTSPLFTLYPSKRFKKLWSEVKSSGRTNCPLPPFPPILPNSSTTIGCMIQTWSSRILFSHSIFWVLSIEIKPKWGLRL